MAIETVANTGTRDVNAEFASEKLNQLATVRERQAWLKEEEAKGNVRLQGSRTLPLASSSFSHA